LQPGVGHPHPRGYGTFPRVLGHYVREEGVLDLQTALIKMTSMPADRLGLKDRGYLKEGMKADITVFDAATIKDMGTFEIPHQYPVGIDYVLVNGKMMVDQGSFTAERSGRVLLKN
jgi:N-acyl-D-amino-acid deacylase